MNTDNLSRVFESRICITPRKLAAMNRPHGDQAARRTSRSAPALAVHESHDVGIPFSTFDTGERIWSEYSFRTTDD